jgi:SAM-dependent methyltransferase
MTAKRRLLALRHRDRPLLGPLPNQYERPLSPAEIEAGVHREWVGGLWGRVGELQFDFLRARGLQPSMRLLDVGCGCLRGGIHFVRWLEPGHYFGLDVNESLLVAGRQELAAVGLDTRLPPGNLQVSAEFEGGKFRVDFDMVLAQSVFSHLPASWLRRCLLQLERCTRPGAQFYATYFHCPDDWPWSQPRFDAAHEGTTYPDRDPFHYRVADLRQAADGLAWRFEPLGAWNHPRGQHMALFLRR